MNTFFCPLQNKKLTNYRKYEIFNEDKIIIVIKTTFNLQYL